MDLLNHIPFGVREEVLKYVDVADVPKGRACACIFPSCKIPLIARKGKLTDGTLLMRVDPERGYEYSIFVSVMAMTKQIVESGFRLSTPADTDNVSERQYRHRPEE